MLLINGISKSNGKAMMRVGSAVASMEAALIAIGLMTYLQKEL